MTTITVLIPAHNEAEQIAETIESLLGQSLPPSRIIVVSDNSTDDTVEIASRYPVIVMETVGNRHKKAGAMNQALEIVMPGYRGMIVTMDADTVLSPTWIEDAVIAHGENPDAGAISGTYTARRGKGLIALLQKIEYHQVHRRISRRGGHVYVLSGTATMFNADVLRKLKVVRGFYYDNNSLVEDFDITLTLRFNGFKPRTFKHLITTTDVMETWSDLTNQRVRWQRGTLETLLKYGWRKHTKKMWLGQTLSYAMTLLFIAIFSAWGLTIYMHTTPSYLWLSVTPIFMLAQYVETRLAGPRETLVAVLLIPLWFYDLYRIWVYWIAAGRVIRKTQSVWN